MEFLLGYPRNHTRGVSRTERYRALGNSFQVDTVAYHLSVLRNMFLKGMNALSLFSSIGGAEEAQQHYKAVYDKSHRQLEFQPSQWSGFVFCTRHRPSYRFGSQ
ncbi:hypothetical protein GUJ93_ZPchr0001g32832 [Zizania palustris]|uniref:DNA (cytosine-5-)-methyltransferase n=1 Tax=Zizania palustris TaxID=103762 RepID=A0A8J5RLY9_ZIZPA|nr:hypothetical protein GUJ93_ZPchr0001g32832 [Zizania palustris]